MLVSLLGELDLMAPDRKVLAAAHEQPQQDQQPADAKVDVALSSRSEKGAAGPASMQTPQADEQAGVVQSAEEKSNDSKRKRKGRKSRRRYFVNTAELD